MSVERPVVVVIPTFGEAANIPELLLRMAELPDARRWRALIVDDDSGDGIALALARLPPLPLEVALVRREGPKGRGRAGREGFQLALDGGAELIVEMDGDGSHDPADIPRLIAATEDCDAAFGSRFVAGGSDGERILSRKIFTRLANLFVRAVLGIPLLDPNSGFRCYRRAALEAIGAASLRSQDCEIVQETAWRLSRRGLRIREIPVDFHERRSGKTTKTLRDVRNCFWTTLLLRLQGVGRP
ncbi:MAG: glycosyltransferase [Elusimicrobiota bacterium]